MDGSMYVGDFVEVVTRNARDNFGGVWVASSRWGERHKAPPGTCTIHFGPLGGRKAARRNVSVPFIPEDTVYTKDGVRVDRRGWKPILKG